jgi:hypothetical protein
MFANFAHNFAFLLGVKPLWSVFSHFARCFPVSSVFPVFLGVSRFPQCFPFPRGSRFCSMFSILLGVFSFGWGSQNYEQKFVFMTTLNIFAWSNQNSKPKYTFTSFYSTEYPSPQKKKKPDKRTNDKTTILLGPTKTAVKQN